MVRLFKPSDDYSPATRVCSQRERAGALASMASALPDVVHSWENHPDWNPISPWGRMKANLQN
jgi:hypothetical protein